jgi:hypothetical protein
MLMDTNDRTVDVDLFEIGIVGQHGEDPLPDAAFFPPGEPLIDAVRNFSISRGRYIKEL